MAQHNTGSHVNTGIAPTPSLKIKTKTKSKMPAKINTGEGMRW